jgi:dihydroorotate dehydrogenase
VIRLWRAPLALLHRLEPEQAHRLTLKALALGVHPMRRPVDDPALRCRLLGRDLTNPLGLAAGFDKDAEVPDAMLAYGFGFVEVGSVTPLPQAGNPRPRVFRLTEDQAVINRLGFNSRGHAAAAARLTARAARPGMVGVNLGANAASPDRVADYVAGLRALGPLAAYVAINISSPNTPGLRALQGKDELDGLLRRLMAARGEAGLRQPIVLKVSPDLQPDEVEAIATLALAHGVAGLIVGNTTLGCRDGLNSRWRGESGGLSGLPLFAPSTALLGEFYRRTRGRLTLIGCGGVASGADAYAKIRAGASAVQLYTALIYHGPSLVGAIKRELAQLLKADGFASVADAVGANWRS